MATPGVRPTSEQIQGDEPLKKELHTAFRGAAARANYLALDRLDLQFGAKEICRWMASPTELSWTALKRLCRFLVGLPRLVYRYPWQEANSVEVYSDTDWSGCPITRKSTSGGCIMIGAHVLKTWSSTIASVALSSGEAEFYGVVRASGMGLGFQSLLADYGIDLPLRVWTDSTAAAGICARQGLGGQRHIATHSLWVQQAIRGGRFSLNKIDGERNPADLFTKHMPSREKLSSLVKLFGCKYAEGRAASAPNTRATQGTKRTMAEYNTLNRISHDDALEVPHLKGEDYVRKNYPAIKPEGRLLLDDDPPHDESLLARGTQIAREIMQDALKNGRRRNVTMRKPDGSVVERSVQGPPLTNHSTGSNSLRGTTASHSALRKR